MGPKSLYEYDNYRHYLKDHCDQARARDKKYSFRLFSKLAGFSSPNYFQRIIDGSRNLSQEGIAQVIQALKLGKDEAIFFKSLVLLNQAATAEEKERHAREIFRSRAYKKIFPFKESQFHFFSKWYFAVIRELVALPEFREDHEWIAKKTAPAITPAEAKRAIQEMVAIGILERDGHGKLRQSGAFLMTSDEVTSSSVARYHREMMTRASESIDRVPREKRELSALTLGLSKEKASEIKGMIQEFRKRLMEVATQDENPRAVYQLNFHLFPLTELEEDEVKK